MAFSLHLYDAITFSRIFLPCSILLLVILYYCYRLSGKWLVSKDKVTAPEVSGGWPIFGHISLLEGPTPSHKTLGALVDKYGPIFSIRIGSYRGLIISSSEMAKQCFTTNDLAMASRPDMIAAKHFGYNNAMFAFSPYGPFWREIRKISTIELLSNQRLEMLKHIRISEVATFLKDLHIKCTSGSSQVSVEMKQWLSDLTLNVVLRMVASKRYPSLPTDDDHDVKESRLVKNAIREFFSLLGLFVPGDAVPWLRWLDLGGYEKAMKKASMELDGIFSQWLKEHKLKSGAGDRNERDFMDVMLSELNGSSFAGHDNDAIIKATIMNLIAGGSDTTAVTLTWAISLLLNKREALKKAQDELDHRVGKNIVVDVSDISELPYIQAIVKETLRLYPAAPLSGPHVVTKECKIGGYHVPKGTRILTNLWKIQTDPARWPDQPLEFKPERFLTATHKDVDIRGQNFELIPFGSGRRSCPGISFALQIVSFTLARLLHGFDISTPLNDTVDMTEEFGFINLKATPLYVLVKPRLPAELYA